MTLTVLGLWRIAELLHWMAWVIRKGVTEVKLQAPTKIIAAGLSSCKEVKLYIPDRLQGAGPAGCPL